MRNTPEKAGIDYLIAITGASGAIYARRLMDELTKRQYRLGIIFSRMGEKVFAFELGLPAEQSGAELIARLYPTAAIEVYDNQQLFAPPASGSRVAKAMVILPCSLGTVSRIAAGNGNSLIERAADVYLKENQPLILVPRETPLSAIHLENLLKLSRLGVRIVAAMPGFYQKPQRLEDLVDFMVGKVLDALRISHELYPAWEGGEND